MNQPHKLQILISITFILLACSAPNNPDKKEKVVSKSTAEQTVRPSGLSASSANGEITLSWPKYSDAIAYNIYWSEVTQNQQSKIRVEENSSEYTQASLENGKAYRYRYTIETSHGESEQSNEIIVTPQTLNEQAPQNLAVFPGDKRITLTWNKPDPDVEISHYNIYWNETGNVTLDDIKTTTLASPAVHADLTNGKQYYYKVTAVMSDNSETPASSEATTSPRLPQLPPPTSIRVSSSSNQVQLDWAKVEGATAYHIYWDANKEITKASNRISDVTPPFIHEELNNLTRYHYRVSAAHEEGESALSDQVAALPYSSQSNAPAQITAIAGLEEVTLSWSPVDGANSYNLYWRKDNIQYVLSNIASSENEELTFTHANLGSDSAITYGISAVINGVEGKTSVETTVAPKPPLPPAPTNVVAIAGDQQITMVWEDVNEAVSYNLYWNTSGEFGVDDQVIYNVSPPYTHIELENGETYFYAVSAVGGSGESEVSDRIAHVLKPIETDISNTTETSVPNSPTLQIVSNEANNITLEWQAVTNSDSYNLYWSTTPDFTIETSNQISNVSTPHQHSNLQQGTTYYFQLAAMNEAGESLPSSQVNSTTILLPPVFDNPSEFTVSENTNIITTITATDATNNPIRYTISGGFDASQFNIDQSSGELSFIAPLDYEQPTDTDNDNVYLLQVNAATEAASSTQEFTVTVTNVNDNAPVLNTANLTIEENHSEEIIFSADDLDGDELRFQLSGTDSNQFSINPITGGLTFITPPDFDAPLDNNFDNLYSIEISVSDTVHTTTNPVTIAITNIADTLQFISENTFLTPEEEIINFSTSAISEDNALVTYQLSGEDSELFTINNSSGEFQFISPPDYENANDTDNNNIYHLQVSATAFDTTITQDITVTVTNINDNAPALNTANLTIEENHTEEIAFSADDLDGDDLRFQLSGTDSNQFSINPITGGLTFITPPDFDAPLDNNFDNLYSIEISVSDAVHTTTNPVIIAITNIPDSLRFVSDDHLEITEEEVKSFFIFATNEDRNITYQLNESDDSTQFTFDENSGELRFITPPDFETPSDFDQDNIYELSIIASDLSNSIEQTISITVLDRFPYDTNDEIDIDGDGINDNSDAYPNARDRFTIPQYLPIDILASETNSVFNIGANDINNAGTSVGTIGRKSLFYSDSETFSPPNFYRTELYAINNNGQVATAVGGNNGYWEAVVWDSMTGILTEIRAEPLNVNSAIQGIPYGINDSGYVTGGAFYNGNQGFIWREGESTEFIGTLGGTVECPIGLPGTPFTTDTCPDSVGIDINEASEVVGYSYTPSGERRAIYYTSVGGLINLGLPDHVSIGESEATAINNRGKIIGTFIEDDLSSSFIYSWETDRMYELEGFDGPTSAFGINDNNIIVGTATKNGSRVAVMWFQGKIIDLNLLLSPDSGWILESATAVNEENQILGHGSLNDKITSFRMDPIAGTFTRESAPIANAGPVEENEALLPVNFDATNSYSPDEQPLTYLWDFGDGNTSTEVSPTHTYSEVGLYTVTLVVNDGTYNSLPISFFVNITVPTDTDGDDTPDVIDAFPFNATEWLDSDGDNIGNNRDEDDDNDRIPDYWELLYISDGLSPTNANDANQNLDDDELTNLEEYERGTSPIDADTDGDGILDHEDPFPNNVPPIAYGGNYVATQNQSFMGILPVVEHDTDLLQFEIIDPPTLGNVEILNPSLGIFQYTPTSQTFTETDIFSYVATDHNLQSSDVGYINVDLIPGSLFSVTKTEDSADGACDDDCSLREAVIAANETLGPDVIALPSGHYTLSLYSPTADDLSQTGDLDILDDLIIRGAGEETTIIDGGGADRIFDIHHSQVTLSEITVQSGWINDEIGAGVKVSNSIVNIDNSVLTNNLGTGTSSGGGIGVSQGNFDDTISQVLITNTVIAENCAPYGGGVYANDDLIIDNSTIRDNNTGRECIDTVESSDGGGVYKQWGTMRMMNSAVVGNNVLLHSGGGIFSWGSYIMLINSTFAYNSARYGGGLDLMSGQHTLINTTVSFNETTEYGGGISSISFQGNGQTRFKNTILSGNFAPLDTDCSQGWSSGSNSYASFGNNLFGDIEGCEITLQESDITDPLFSGTFYDSGEPGHAYVTPDPTSLSFDSGDDLLCPALDQIGNSRPNDGNGDGWAQCDMGSYER